MDRILTAREKRKGKSVVGDKKKKKVGRTGVLRAPFQASATLILRFRTKYSIAETFE